MCENDALIDVMLMFSAVNELSGGGCIATIGEGSELSGGGRVVKVDDKVLKVFRDGNWRE